MSIDADTDLFTDKADSPLTRTDVEGLLINLKNLNQLNLSGRNLQTPGSLDCISCKYRSASERPRDKYIIFV